MAFREIGDIQLDDVSGTAPASKGFRQVTDIQLDEPEDDSLLGYAKKVYGRQSEKISGIEQFDQTGAEDVLQTVGAVGSGVGDVAFEGVKRGVQALLPDEYEQAIVDEAKEFAQTELGQKILGGLSSAGESMGEIAQEYPRLARNLEGLLGVAELAPVGYVASKGAKGVVKGVERYAPSSKKEELLDIFKGGDDVANIQDKVERLADYKRREYGDLYRQADEAGKGAYITGEDALMLKPKLEFAKSKLNKASDREVFDSIISQIEGIKGKTLEGAPKSKVDLNVNLLNGIRQEAGKGFAEGKAKSIIDEVISSAADKGNIAGNAEAGALWKEATQRFRQYKNTFEDPKSKPLVKKIVESDLTPEDLASQMFGAGSIGTGRKAGQRYDEFVSVLGKDVEPDLKRAVVSKIMQFSAEPSADRGENMAWLQRVAREVNQLQTKNKSLWNKFDKAEKDALIRMSKEAQRATEGGVVNKAINGVLGIAGKVFAKGGLRTDLALPSTLAPKKLADVEDIIDMSRSKTPTRMQRLKEDITKGAK